MEMFPSYQMEIIMEQNFFQSSLSEEIVTAMGKGFELLSRGIHMGKTGVVMMPVPMNSR